MPSPLRSLPSVSELIASPRLRDWMDRVSHTTVVVAARRVLDEVRHQLRAAATENSLPSPAELIERISSWIDREERQKLIHVINGTGVLLHTGLGRAPWAAEAMEAAATVSRHYCTLEIDAESGERRDRNASVERLLVELTHAEAALVVNNNAAATLLALAATAAGKQVIVSRGELVEIGGSYRLPDVMTAGGTILKEVGTTNRTRISDYEQAISSETAAILRVHPSNFRMMGFSESTRIEELVKLGKSRSLTVIDDLGSGALIDFARFGLNHEPLVSASIAAGADLVLFSGDKLLGGPQAGLICGRREAVAKLARHPLARAVRVDKVTLAALEATLRLYRDPSLALHRIPLLAMLDTPLANLQLRANSLVARLQATGAVSQVEQGASRATLGGGTTPLEEIDSWELVITPRGESVDRLAKRLRTGSPSVFVRIKAERVRIDLRTLFPEDDAQLVEAFRQLVPEQERLAAVQELEKSEAMTQTESSTEAEASTASAVAPESLTAALTEACSTPVNEPYSMANDEQAANPSQDNSGDSQPNSNTT